ncbi:hypothetical protein A6C57_18600 [Fibrella sp. ES10-3-2-2]|nr:hypothetical protein A6C57_18600 [Fibrella sp. ES10-3-2-2]
MTENELIQQIRQKKSEIDRLDLEQLGKLKWTLKEIDQLLLDLAKEVGFETDRGRHFQHIAHILYGTIEKEATRIISHYEASNKPRASAISKRRVEAELTELKQRVGRDLFMVNHV